MYSYSSPSLFIVGVLFLNEFNTDIPAFHHQAGILFSSIGKKQSSSAKPPNPRPTEPPSNKPHIGKPHTNEQTKPSSDPSSTNEPTTPAWDHSSFGWKPSPVQPNTSPPKQPASTDDSQTEGTTMPPWNPSSYGWKPNSLHVQDDVADMDYDGKEVPTQPFEEWLGSEMPWLNNDIESFAAALNSKPVIVQVANNTTNINIQVDQSSNTTNETTNNQHTTNNTVNNQSTSSSNIVNNNNLNQTAKISAVSSSPRESEDLCSEINNTTQSSIPTASSSSQQIREDLCAADEIINNATQSTLAGINLIRPRRSIVNFYRRKGCTSPQAKAPTSKLRALTFRPHIKKFINEKVRHVRLDTAVPTADKSVPTADEEYDRVRAKADGKYMKMSGKRGINDV